MQTMVEPYPTSTLPVGTPAWAAVTRTVTRATCSWPYVTLADETDSATEVVALTTDRYTGWDCPGLYPEPL